MSILAKPPWSKPPSEAVVRIGEAPSQYLVQGTSTSNPWRSSPKLWLYSCRFFPETKVPKVLNHPEQLDVPFPVAPRVPNLYLLFLMSLRPLKSFLDLLGYFCTTHFYKEVFHP